MKVTVPNFKRRDEVDSTIQSQSSNQRYSDLETAYMDKSGSGDITINVGSASILDAVKNILITNRGEIVYNPDKGADITKMVFQGSLKDSNQFTSFIKSQVENNDNRVKVRSASVEQNPDDHSALINIVVDVKGDDRYKGLVLRFPVKRMTQV